MRLAAVYAISFLALFLLTYWNWQKQNQEPAQWGGEVPLTVQELHVPKGTTRIVITIYGSGGFGDVHLSDIPPATGVYKK